MEYPKNTSRGNPSVSKSLLSFDNYGPDKLLGYHVTRDQCKSALGDTMVIIAIGNMTNIGHIGSTSNVK